MASFFESRRPDEDIQRGFGQLGQGISSIRGEMRQEELANAPSMVDSGLAQGALEQALQIPEGRAILENPAIDTATAVQQIRALLDAKQGPGVNVPAMPGEPGRQYGLVQSDAQVPRQGPQLPGSQPQPAPPQDNGPARVIDVPVPREQMQAPRQEQAPQYAPPQQRQAPRASGKMLTNREAANFAQFTPFISQSRATDQRTTKAQGDQALKRDSMDQKSQADAARLAVQLYGIDVRQDAALQRLDQGSRIAVLAEMGRNLRAQQDIEARLAMSKDRLAEMAKRGDPTLNFLMAQYKALGGSVNGLNRDPLAHLNPTTKQELDGQVRALQAAGETVLNYIEGNAQDKMTAPFDPNLPTGPMQGPQPAPAPQAAPRQPAAPRAQPRQPAAPAAPSAAPAQGGETRVIGGSRFKKSASGKWVKE